jgi:hypothetical protein
MSEKINDPPFSKRDNMSPPAKSLNNILSSDSDAPDKFLAKMKRTMSKKKT